MTQISYHLTRLQPSSGPSGRPRPAGVPSPAYFQNLTTGHNRSPGWCLSLALTASGAFQLVFPLHSCALQPIPCATE